MTKSQDRLEARRAIQERAIARRHGASRKEERIAKLGTTLNDPLCQHYGASASHTLSGAALSPLALQTELPDPDRKRPTLHVPSRAAPRRSDASGYAPLHHRLPPEWNGQSSLSSSSFRSR